MRCDRCGNDEAVVQLTTVKENESQVRHLCPACAADEGVEVAATQSSAPLVEFLAQIGQSVGEEASALGRCPSCGLTPAQLRQSGRLGCATCYTHYQHHLRALLRRLHGGTQHIGKAVLPPDPEEEDRRVKVDNLRRSLRIAVDAEDFEHAAALRDQIRRIEELE
jgi:protein arginine kinase activator